jgi:hypothetical protein
MEIGQKSQVGNFPYLSIRRQQKMDKKLTYLPVFKLMWLDLSDIA